MKNWLIGGLLFVVVSAVVRSQDCNSAIRVGNSAFTASSDDGTHKPHFARMNGSNNAWCSSPTNKNPFLQIQLPAEYQVNRIVMKGLQDQGNAYYVKKYKLSYMNNGAEYTYLMDLDGPTDQTSQADVQLDLNPVFADAVIIRPTVFVPADDKPCLQLELYGCLSQPPTTAAPVTKAKPAPTQTTPVDHCRVSNGGCQQVCTSQASGPVCSCNNGFILDHDGKACNVDYCMTDNGGCEMNCQNSKIGPLCTCSGGFKIKSDGKNCTNIDECTDGSSNCDRDSTFCFDTNGSYKCYCKSGYRRKTKYKCVDKDECSSGEHICHQQCINIKGSYRCGCDRGYILDRDGHTCNDINECNQDNKCNTTLSRCVNTPGAYKCQCFSGLVNDVQDRFKCVDKNECDYSNGKCDHICTNSYRSYKCSCLKGFHLASDNHTCHDNNECRKNNGGCAHRCINFSGGYRCTCRTGFKLQDDGHSCVDINECNSHNGGCEKYCNNTIGSFICSCDQGYEVRNKLCYDIDECARNMHNCNLTKSSCYNTQGSFQCRCNQGYKLNPSTQKCEAQLCKSSVLPPANGIVEPQRCLSLESNKYGDFCTFKCNAGYKLRENSAAHVYCDSDGFFKQPSGTNTPFCEKIRCPTVSSISNGHVYPAECSTKGAEFGRNCHVGCNGGFTIKGKTTIQCQQNGQYDGSFSQTTCVARPKITCPPDMEETLPLGVGEMLIKLGRINTNVDAKHLKSFPSGVVDGSYKFKPGYTTVRLVASNDVGGSSECSFGVRILDKEPPKVFDCETENQYINIDAKEAIVSWKEPRFVDNAGLLGKPTVNIDNNVLRSAHVYFVAYIARDTSGNKATCKFFVHVNAKYCSQETIPGGKSARITPLGTRYFLSCAGKQFSDGSISVFGSGAFGQAECTNGRWTPSEVPSCVDAVAKVGDCEAGTHATSYKPSPSQFCVNCPPGQYNNVTNGKCVKCPKGFYQDEEKQTRCKRCPAGSTTVSEGSLTTSECKALCSKGSYSKDGLLPLNGCTKCPQGSYQDLDGGSYCKICPERGDTPGEGTAEESKCYVNARITKIIPASQEFVGVVGDNVTIDCWATGSPVPHLEIRNATVLPPERLRGRQRILAQPSTSKYVAKRRLVITNAQVEDTVEYKCIAQNPTISSSAVDERTIKVIIKSRNVAASKDSFEISACSQTI